MSTIRKGQLNFTFSKDAIKWIKDIISRKIENQQELLLMMKTEDDAVDGLRSKSISRLEDYRKKISKLDGEIVSDIASQLRGWKGIA